MTVTAVYELEKILCTHTVLLAVSGCHARIYPPIDSLYYNINRVSASVR